MFDSQHFVLQTLAEGVHAVLHKHGGWAVGNAGILDLGDKTIIFDTGMSPAAGEDLRLAAEELTGRPVTFVVNSHYHNDHIWGNQAFDEGTTIVADERVRALIETEGREEYNWFHDNAEDILSDRLARLASAKSETEKAALNFAVPYYEAIVRSMPTLRVRLPDLTFRNRLTIHGRKRRVVLLSYVNCHTGCDTILHLPDEHILFMSDLLFVKSHPFIADGDPENLLHTVPEIVALNAHILVPGHGPVGGPIDLEHQRAYIEHCRDAARQAVVSGTSAEQLATNGPPPPFTSWDIAMFYQQNVAYYINQFKASARS